jgi:hypothetical protein
VGGGGVSLQRATLEIVAKARNEGATQMALAHALRIEPRNFFFVVQVLLTRKLVRPLSSPRPQRRLTNYALDDNDHNVLPHHPTRQ